MKKELIKGLSGCGIEVREVSSKLILRKSTCDKDYVERLKKQCNKQVFFYKEFFDIDGVVVPQVLNRHQFDSGFYFDMEFFFATDSLNFLQNSSKSSIDAFIDKIYLIIDTNINKSQYSVIEKDDLISKIESVFDSIKNESIKKHFEECFDLAINKVRKIEGEIILPIGHCHGDLTLSNIIVQDGDMILIDFLDSYIETPLQDIVKIRQDTQYYWSMSLSNGIVDPTGVKISLQYIDKCIKDYYQGYEFYRFYEIFQVINLLRIVPYLEKDTLLKKIFNDLTKILKR